MKFLVAAVTLLALSVDCANILFYMTSASYSHKIAMIPLVEELAARGHRVILMTPFESKTKPANITYEDVVPQEIVDWSREYFKDGNAVKDRLNYGVFSVVATLHVAMVQTCDAALRTPLINQFIDREIKLDLIIADTSTTECAAALAQHLQIPFAFYCTTGWYPWIADATGMPSQALYKGGFLNFGYTDVSRFLDRMIAILDFTFWHLGRVYYVFPKIQEAWEKRLGHPVPSILEHEREVSLVLTYAHPVTERAGAYTPNVIDIGGSHIPSTVKPLPKEINAFANKGDFVLVSLGTAANIKSLPDHIFRSFTETFKQLKVNVLWKVDMDVRELEGKISPNVLAVNWLPQFDVLAHKNCKVFVTHGGKLGTTETVYHGVPVVVIPFFTDQDGHGSLAEREGYGLLQYISELTDTSLYEKIQTILNDSRFRENAQRLQSIIKDELVPPVKKGAYWVEYVIRHKGAPHLRPYARHLTWWQYHLLDVWLFIGTILSLVIFTLVLLTKYVYNRVFPRKTKTE